MKQENKNEIQHIYTSKMYISLNIINIWMLKSFSDIYFDICFKFEKKNPKKQKQLFL